MWAQLKYLKFRWLEYVAAVPTIKPIIFIFGSNENIKPLRENIDNVIIKFYSNLQI